MMNCSDVEKKWEQYLNGKLTAADEEQIEAHLNGCNACGGKLNDELINEGILNEEKQTRILKYAKWKSRFSNAVFVFLLVLLVTLVSGILSGIYYGIGQPSRADNATRVAMLMTELTMPNIIPRSGGSGIRTFFRMESSYELEKRIGREMLSIGILETKMLFNRMNMVRNWHGGSLDVKLYFDYPTMQGQLSGAVETWRTLEILPEGTVSELAVSFDQSYSLDEVYEIFTGYDVDYFSWILAILLCAKLK